MATTTKKQNRSESSVQSSTKGNRKRAKREESLSTVICSNEDPHTMSAEAILEELLVFVEDYNVEFKTEFQLPEAVFCWNWYNSTRREIAEEEFIRLARAGKIPSVRWIASQQYYGGLDFYIKTDHPAFRETPTPDTGYYTGRVIYYNMTIDQIYDEIDYLSFKHFDLDEKFTLAEEMYAWNMFEPTRRKLAERQFKADTEAGETSFGLVKGEKRDGKDLFFQLLSVDFEGGANCLAEDCEGFEDFDNTDYTPHIEDQNHYNMDLDTMLSKIYPKLVEFANSTDKPFTLPEAIAQWNLFEASKRKLAEEEIASMVAAGKGIWGPSEFPDIHVVYGEQRNGHRLFIKCSEEEFCYNMSVEAIVNSLVALVQCEESSLKGFCFTLPKIERRWNLFEPTRREMAEKEFHKYISAGHVPFIEWASIRDSVLLKSYPVYFCRY